MTEQWWGKFSVPEGEMRYWQAGPFRLWAARASEEWRLATESRGDGMESEQIVNAEPPEEPGEAAAVARLGFRNAPESLWFLPATADRPVVVAAASPFFIPPGEEISLFVSTSLRLQVRTVPTGADLLDVPLFRSSDTWFGSSTLQGELCYAARIGIRYALANVPRRPHRAITVVRIRNRATTQLGLERLKLPLPNLSLFAADDGPLWTETVTLERESEDERASVRIGHGAPGEAGHAERVTTPREPLAPGLLTRTFGSLFGLRGGKSYERISE